MDREEAGKWEAVRAKGRNRYVWMRALFVGVCMELVTSAALGSLDPAAVPAWVLDMSTGFILFAVVGYAWGAWVWRKNETRYARFMERLDAP
ncbi:MAG: hypothetical protein AB7E47_16725 [Desulfovibrionaceae bacterium]